MFLSAYKKDGMNKSHKEKLSSDAFSPHNSESKYSRNSKDNVFYTTKNNQRQSESLKKISNGGSNFSLDKFENKTKKGIKFGLLEYKRSNEIKNFDICNGNFLF